MLQVTLKRRNANVFHTQELNVVDEDRFKFLKEKHEGLTEKL